ncbi:MAG: hypothetical protein VB855_15375 [Pirellulaceae bacterium]
MGGRPRFRSITLLVFFLPGCSSSPTSPDIPPPSPGAALAIKRVDASQLPALGDYFPPLDEGRLMLAPPSQWSWASRREGYLARIFVDKTRRVRLPRIWVTVEDPRDEATGQLTEENLVAHARFVQSRLDADDIKLVEPVRPLVIGTVPCIRYVRATRFRVREERSQSLTAERQILETIQAGRRYTIDLHVHPGTILRHRDDAYAMLAGMEFITAMTTPQVDPGIFDPGPAGPEN